MPQISPKQTPPVSSSIARDAQDRGALPLGAVQRVQNDQSIGAAEESSSNEQVNPTRSVGEQVTLSPMDQLKEMLRQRVADLYSRSETLVRRIAMSGPEQVESLSKELKRLSLELKRLVSQYKALKGMANMQSFGVSSQPASDSLSSLSNLTNVSDVLKVPEVSTSQVAEALPSEAIEPLLDVEQGTGFEDSNLEKLKQDAIALYEQLSREDDRSEKDSGGAAEGDRDEDGMEAIFKEILKKLQEARELLELKAGLADDQDSSQVREDVKRLENELVSELAQLDLASLLF